ncbi:hypothetical protein OB955_10550 [Halobacteria archaeon AArc-m2/3/4]|uniref:Uncharacterized protein n=1 Tax=Natronoglomus mannanivorans TaxID=2979990 RepID=A0ABT2QE29_9EURY|nr:hypothetical protein [Halobacteria archaeon AArc-m2/3/4]
MGLESLWMVPEWVTGILEAKRWVSRTAEEEGMGSEETAFVGTAAVESREDSSRPRYSCGFCVRLRLEGRLDFGLSLD